MNSTFMFDTHSLPIGEYDEPSRGYFLEHLTHYCSLFSPSPPVTLDFEQGQVGVVRGMRYLRVARELGRKRTLGVVVHSDVPSLVADPSWKRIGAELIQLQPVPDCIEAWHVFYFRRPLQVDERTMFVDAATSGGLIANRIAWHDHGAACDLLVEDMRASVPHQFHEVVANVRDFDATVVPIVSFQGVDFERMRL